MKQTKSVYQISENGYSRVFLTMADMRIIMVKGIGYIVVNKRQNNPNTFRSMGESVAKAFES